MIEAKISTLSEDHNQSGEGYVSRKEGEEVIEEFGESIMGDGRVFQKITSPAA